MKKIQAENNYKIDGLQYCNWSREIFLQMRSAAIDAVHVTICYHEMFREVVTNIEKWNLMFLEHSDLIMHGKSAEDIVKARKSEKTAIFFGFQNCSPIEDDIGLVEICYTLGARFMQLSYNNQSFLASGCYEKNDSGITRMGIQVIQEMNRLGLVIDMSHSSEKSTLEAIELSQKPIAITHANPNFWHQARRNKSNEVIKQLAASEGMLGFSIYPYHLKNGSHCTLEDFCKMIYQVAEMVGVNCLGIGSDLCQNQPNEVVQWMRNGRWTKEKDFGESTLADPNFPPQPSWFQNNKNFPKIAKGLSKVGFSQEEVNQIMGMNWFNFFQKSFK